MHPEGYKPFHEALTSWWNTAFLVIGVVVLVDLFTGSRLMLKLVDLQLHMQGLHLTSPHLRLQTIFGTYTDPKAWARLLGWILSGAGIGVPILSYLKGLYTSLR